MNVRDYTFSIAIGTAITLIATIVTGGFFFGRLYERINTELSLNAEFRSAGKVLNGYQPTPEEIKSLAACVLTQVEDQILVKKPEMQRIKIVDYDPQGSVPDGVDTMIKPVS